MDRISPATPEGATEQNQPRHDALSPRPVVEIDHSLAEARINSPKMQALVAAAFAKHHGASLASEAAPKRAPKRGLKQAPARQALRQQVPLDQIRPRLGQVHRASDPAADLGESIDSLVQDAPPSDALSVEAPAEPDEAATLLHEAAVLATLRTTQKGLLGLLAPVDTAHWQEVVTMLTATRDAIAVTLARSGVQA